MDAPAVSAALTAPGKGARLRWTICGLLFAAVVLSYIDRLVLSVLKPTLQQLYGWSETGYGDVVFWFQAAYGIGFLLFGRLIDRIGAKAGYLLAMAVWTAAHMAHALFTSTRGFAIVRAILALGESGTYPAALAAASEWFPRRERALAIGIFNAGANMGAIITPMIVPAIALAMNWQAAFVVTGSFNLIWMVAWFVFYRRPCAQAGDARLRDRRRPGNVRRGRAERLDRCAADRAGLCRAPRLFGEPLFDARRPVSALGSRLGRRPRRLRRGGRGNAHGQI